MPDTNHDFILDTFEHASLAAEVPPAYRVHPTAVLEPGVTVGRGTVIWDSVHVRAGTSIGDECIVGEKTYLAYNVRVGHRCKINNFVYICTAVTIEDGVMVSAGSVFTNDKFPRAATPDLLHLNPSEPDEHTRPTLVRHGATIGANCTVGCNLAIGRFAMIGMGSVVTKSVPDFALVFGNPAAVVGAVCRCGQLLLRHLPNTPPTVARVECAACARRYEMAAGKVTEADAARTPPAGVARG